jgi:hypothetical protein
VDHENATRLRINLPLPDCAVRRSDCEDLAVINTLDGFHVEPRLSIPFDGPIDVTTATSETIFLVRLEEASCDGDEDCDDQAMSGGQTIGINQVVWDSETDTLHLETNEMLDQHARYALIVTRGVRDQFGQPVEATLAFRRFRQSVRSDYKRSLLAAVRAARRVGVSEQEIVTASVFTTQTVTAVLEKIHDQIKATTPEPADFGLGPGGVRTVFALDTVAGITWDQQTGADPPTFTRITVNSSLLDEISPGAVGAIAFGKYASPDYEVHPGEFIPPIGTRTGSPRVQSTNEIYFNLFLPSGPKPAGGWPVAIFGHGNTRDKNILSIQVAATMASHGIATMAINAVGHGFGSLGTLTVGNTDGSAITFSAGGRGIDQNGDHVIDANEGFATAPPRAIVFFADGIQQTVADLLQMVRVIDVGVDVDGDSLPDLNPSRIYYFGHSNGANYGTVFMSVEPAVLTGAFTSLGDPIENRRLSPGSRPMLGQWLASRVPPLINAPGITELDGVPVGPPHFHDNFPLRDGIPLNIRLADGTSQQIETPVSNTVAGAMAIQEMIENTKWVGDRGDPVAYAPHLRKTPLAGVPAKSVICQFSKGDQSAPNPNATAILRAGDLADRTTLYRHDVAYAEDPTLPKDPHGLMVNVLSLAYRPISLAAQEQIAIFFATDGARIIQPQPVRFFEVPIAGPLPEALNYIP